MKKLSDYKGEEAIELWADILEPLNAIFTDNEFAEAVRSGKSKMELAKLLLKNHAKETEEVLLRIDNEPIDGLSILIRVIALLAEIGQNEYAKTFFGFAEQVKKE